MTIAHSVREDLWVGDGVHALTEDESSSGRSEGFPMCRSEIFDGLVEHIERLSGAHRAALMSLVH